MRNLLGLWESHVHDEDELEGVVEGEPVGGVDEGFDDGEEGVDDPVLAICQNCLLIRGIAADVSMAMLTVSH